jgi:membrane protein YqaA with SNARE-associated domain
MKKKKKLLKSRTFYLVVTSILLVAILSLTIGRDVYLGRPSNNIYSFAILHFAGYLFFLIMPVEAAFYYFMTFYDDDAVLVAVAISTALAAQLIDYYCGYAVSKQIIKQMVNRERYERVMKLIKRYGNLVILLFNLFPLSSPLLILAAGMIKYPLLPVVFYSLAGLLLKYLIMLWFL